MLLVRRYNGDSLQSLPPITRNTAKRTAATSTASPPAAFESFQSQAGLSSFSSSSSSAPSSLSPRVAAVVSVVPSVSLSSTRERRVLARASASSAAFSAFQSALASRVLRPAESLCMTNASDEYRQRQERAALNEHEKRIARQAAATHITLADKLTAAQSEGGLPLPWEQSLRGATNHSVGVGGLFSGLYCRITQPDMKEMEIVRSVKIIDEQPLLSTKPRGRGKGGKAARQWAGADGRQSAQQQSVAALQLVEEAGRLQQLSRLGTLGVRSKAKATGQEQTAAVDDAAAEDEEAMLRLGDLIVRGTPLFDGIEPPPLPSKAATEAALLTSRGGDSAADEAGVSAVSEQQSVGAEVALSFVLSRSNVAFQQRHFPGSKCSAFVTVHNPTASTLQFAFSRLPHHSAFDACSPHLPGRSSFVLSHPAGYVLPRSSLELCVTFAPSAAGVWTERWLVEHTDRDGESHTLAPATLSITGTSQATVAPHNNNNNNTNSNTPYSRGGQTPPSAPHTLRSIRQEETVAASFHSSSSLSSSELPSAPRPSTLPDSELRSAFCAANSSRRLHFHRSLMAHWWSLWSDVRQLHRPLDRQRMEWRLSAQQIEHAIDQLPRRHKPRQAALHARLEELQALAAVVPTPHPARVALLASLLAALASGLPAFASQLRLVHKHTQPPPWETRARDRERRLMEFEDSLGHMADEQQRVTAAEQQRRQQQDRDELSNELDRIQHQRQQQQQTSGEPTVVGSAGLAAPTGDRAAELDDAARVRESDQRMDAEWRQRDAEWRQRLESESRLVLAAIIGAFGARAGAIGSDQPPPDAEQLPVEAAHDCQLPVAFPALIIEPEPEADSKGKGKAGKAKK